MFLSFAHRRIDGELMVQIALEPLPAWQIAVLEPVPVSQRLGDPSDVVLQLKSSETFPVIGEPRERALRLLDALVIGGRERGMTVSLPKKRASGRARYTTDALDEDTVQFMIEGTEFVLRFKQATLHEPHEPTEQELASARRGYLFPDFDDVPDEHLGIELEGDGGTFWAGKWKDADDHRLEEDLAQILDEIQLRRGSLLRQKENEQKRQEQRRRDWAVAREAAVAKYRQLFLLKAMHAQSVKWAEADGLRRYAEAIRDKARQLDGDERDQALEWAERIERQAGRIDPLSTGALPPAIPEPAPHDLQPFMGSWSSYGP
jgi:hypothetical protein